MKIVIFGASGKTGILTVYQALDKGHHVTAFSRIASNVTIQHKNLRVVEGDIRDYQKVKQTILAHDVVISTLGVHQHKPNTILSEGTANILKAMDENQVKRFICMSSAGILGNDSGFFFGKIIIPLWFKHTFRDKKRQLAAIRQSSCEWVVIRPSRLTDAPRTKAYHITMGAPASGSVPRADVADFMLKLLTDKTYDRKTPAISGYN